MNNTKWEELRLAMYALGPLSPRFRIKDREHNEPFSWDGEWFYHFRECGYDSIEWVELKTVDLRQRDAVRDCLRAIHVPGTETEQGFRVLGWVKSGQSINFV